MALDCTLRQVMKMEVGSAIATSSTWVCSNGTLPSISSKFATCQPSTSIIPEPKPQIPLPTLAAKEEKQYSPSAGVAIANWWLRPHPAAPILDA